MQLYTKETGVPYRDFTLDLLREVVESLALGTYNWAWRTDLPYGRDWLKATPEEVAEMERKSSTHEQWVYGPEVWAAMPWGRDAGIWSFSSQGNGARWSEMPASQRIELPAEKPTWDQVWTVIRPLIVKDWQDRQLFNGETQIQAVRNGITRKPIELPNVPGLHTGRGLDHMPALIHAVSAGDLAGAHFAPAVMRHKDGPGTAAIWTRGDAHELLGRLSAQTNRAESAYNIVKQEYLALAQPLLDERGMLGEEATAEEILAAKEAAIQKAHAFIQRPAIEAAYEKALATLGGLPTDLDTLRRVLAERLEEAGMAHIKHMRGVVSQQGIDLPHACDETETAAKRVAVLVHHHQQEIDTKSTVADAKAEFDRGKAAIEAVQPLNIPTFHLRGVTAAQPSPAKFAKTRLEMTIRQKALPIGRVSILGTVTDGAMNLVLTRRTVNEIDFYLEIADAPATIALEGRNLCGPASCVVTLTPPAEDD